MAALRFALLLALLPSVARADYGPSNGKPPEPLREFRAAWVATVHNIDWPSKPGLPAEKQKAELAKLFDLAAEARLNAIIFQVRPEGDALYASKIEPWSHWVSGKAGRPPGYDPLQAAIEEAHRRGMELHAWFNPFRAKTSRDASASPEHMSRQHPEWMLPSGSQVWANPGLRPVQNRAIEVMTDVLSRYDVDGIHIDDYFYPYPKKVNGRMIQQFDDSAAYGAYQRGGGRLAAEDWRRAEMDGFIQRLHGSLKRTRPAVKFGISPFGIWRPGNPAGIEADLDSYKHIAADSRRWLQEGWLDYLSPQLYWRIGDRPHSYTTLVRWWGQQNTRGRHLWPGMASSRIQSSDDPGRPASEIGRQISATREVAPGHLHWSFKAIAQNRDGLRSVLASAYEERAIPPPSPWLSSGKPNAPAYQVRMRPDGGATLVFSPAPAGVRWRVVQYREEASGAWRTMGPVFAAFQEVPLRGAPAEIAVRHLDAAWVASAPAVQGRR